MNRTSSGGSLMRSKRKKRRDMRPRLRWCRCGCRCWVRFEYSRMIYSLRRNFLIFIIIIRKGSDSYEGIIRLLILSWMVSIGIRTRGSSTSSSSILIRMSWWGPARWRHFPTQFYNRPSLSLKLHQPCKIVWIKWRWGTSGQRLIRASNSEIH